jgi:hypothetical protein
MSRLTKEEFQSLPEKIKETYRKNKLWGWVPGQGSVSWSHESEMTDEDWGKLEFDEAWISDWEKEIFWKDPDNYIYEIDVIRTFTSSEKAVSYFCSCLSSRQLGFAISKSKEYDIPLPRLFEGLTLFADKWSIPFDAGIHIQFMETFDDHNRPKWLNSDWSC